MLSLWNAPVALVAGALYPIQALFTLLSSPRLRGYVIVPILINLTLGVTLYAGLLYGGLELIDRVVADVPNWTPTLPDWAVALPSWHFAPPRLPLPALPLPALPLPALPLPPWLQISWPQLSFPSVSWPEGWFQWGWRPQLPGWVGQIPDWLVIALLWLLRAMLTLVLLIVTGIIVLQFGGILGAPWYGKLSEELEQMQTGQVRIVEVGLARDVGRAILYELKKLVVLIFVGIGLLLLNVVPGFGTAIAAFGGIALAALLTGLDFVDAPMERRRLRFRQKLKMLWRSLPASASFALICLGLVSFPLVNLLAIPVCVAAGTLFFCDRIRPVLEPDPPGERQA
ncbi:MAG: hypothetical protein OHK0037_26120 [Elainellaceae cyanobacterium]